MRNLAPVHEFDALETPHQEALIPLNLLTVNENNLEEAIAFQIDQLIAGRTFAQDPEATNLSLERLRDNQQVEAHEVMNAIRARMSDPEGANLLSNGTFDRIRAQIKRRAGGVQN